MKAILKKIINHSVFKNAGALLILQLVNYIVPILLIPYISSRVGLDEYGKIAVCLALIQFSYVFTDYGFNLSATRDVSLNINNKEYINNKINLIIVCKLLILLAIVPVFFVIFYSLNVLNLPTYFLIFTILSIVSQAFQPIWLFQGLEKMKNITIFSFLTKIIYMVLIFSLVKTELDSNKVLFSFFISNFISTILCFYMVSNLGFRFNRVSLIDLKNEFFVGFQYFLSRFCVTIYTSLSTLIVGNISYTQAAYYSLCDQIYRAIQSATSPFTIALFPFMSREKNWKIFYITISFLMISLTFIVSLIFLAGGDLISFVFGSEFSPAFELLKIFSFIAIVNFMATAFGYSAFSALNRIDIANKTVIYASVIHALNLIILNYFDVISAKNIAILVFSTEMIVAISRIFLFIKIKRSLSL